MIKETIHKKQAKGETTIRKMQQLQIVNAAFTQMTTDPPEYPGAGKCADCSCPSFYGSGYTCSRSGCKHHYDRHW